MGQGPYRDLEDPAKTVQGSDGDHSGSVQGPFEDPSTIRWELFENRSITVRGPFENLSEFREPFEDHLQTPKMPSQTVSGSSKSPRTVLERKDRRRVLVQFQGAYVEPHLWTQKLNPAADSPFVAEVMHVGLNPIALETSRGDCPMQTLPIYMPHISTLKALIPAILKPLKSI